MKSQEKFTAPAPTPDQLARRQSDHETFAAARQVCERHSSPAAQRCAEIFRNWLPPGYLPVAAASVPTSIEVSGVEETFVPVPA